MYKKKFFKISGLVLAMCVTTIIMLTGCGKAVVTNGASASSSTKKVTVTIMTRWSGTDPMTALFGQLIKEYESKHPNVTIEDSSIAEEDSFDNKLKSDIATGIPPDIFSYAGVAGLAQWAKSGVIMDVTPLIADKTWSNGFIDGAFDVWNLAKYGIKGDYAIPIQFTPEVLFYNTDLFAKAGITKVPETMDDLYSAIDKLKATNVIPWGLGEKDNWRGGHIIDNLLYREVGVDKVKDLGTRRAKWTDPDVVKALSDLKNLETKGAFEQGAVGTDFGTEESEFLTGKSAIMCNGSWEISTILGPTSKVADKIKFMPFPYFTNKPQLKSNSVEFTQGFMLSGTMKGAEKAAAIDFIKFLTNKDTQTKEMDIGELGSRKDVVAPASASPLLKEMVTYMDTIKIPGGDYFDYDPDPALMDISRTEISNMLLNNTPEQAAKNIQSEINSYVKNN